MKKAYNLLIATIITITLAACSNDSGSYNPYKNQVKKPFYPTTLTFNNINNDGSQIDKKWELTYNDNNTIKAYKYYYNVTASNGVQIKEEHSGELSYHKDPSNSNYVIQNSLTTNCTITSLLKTESYCDKITELANIENETVQKITILGQRTHSTGEEETFNNSLTFTYADKFCTSSEQKDNTGTTTYTYNWGNGKLNNIIKYQQDNGNNITKEDYSYTYDNNTLASDYEFNTLAFIYGNMPEIYAAMNLLGVTSAYKIESESYSGHRYITGNTISISPVNRSYTITEQTNTITYTSDSPSSITHKYIFSRD